MTYRLIATDLDGTLLRSDGTVSPRTVDTLRRAEDVGVTVVIATGRPIRWVQPIEDMLKHTGLAVLSNGAVVYDMHTDRILRTRPITRSTALMLAETVRSALPGVSFAVERVDRGFGLEPGFTRGGIRDVIDMIAPIEELVSDDILKFLIQDLTMGPDDLLTKSRDVGGHLAEFTHSSGHGLVEVSATGVTKASTLERVAADRGITAEQVIAFGDMPNDLPMLAWAGTGYAMSNAHPEVLAATDHRAPLNDDDGVAQVIEDLILRDHPSR